MKVPGTRRDFFRRATSADFAHHHLKQMPRKPSSASIAASAFRAVLLPVRLVIALAVFVDEILRPVYRPIVTAILEHPFFTFLERVVSAFPRWAILIVFSVPFLVAEPLKLVAVILFAKGRVALGVITFVLAQLLTFILVERIFHAGRAKLLTYWWFAWAVERAVEVRNWIHRTGKRMIRRLRAIVRLHA